MADVSTSRRGNEQLQDQQQTQGQATDDKAGTRWLFGFTNVMITLAWVGVFVLVLHQWLYVDNGHWTGLPEESQQAVQGVVLYTTVVQLAMNYAADRLTCVQEAVRCAVMYGILAKFPTTQLNVAYAILLCVWAVAHVIDHAYAVSQLFEFNWPTVTAIYHYCFRFLSPLAVGLEVFVAYRALPLARNVNSNYAMIMISLSMAYLPAFPALFKNRLILRKRYIQRKFVEKNKKNK
ncbi:hypothetical protein BC940DRAFT_301189 [Gongronella butleri]|nr:hypothetical protein BC940DRAFT_301189 [Gongronella butleri]